MQVYLCVAMVIDRWVRKGVPENYLYEVLDNCSPDSSVEDMIQAINYEAEQVLPSIIG